MKKIVICAALMASILIAGCKKPADKATPSGIRVAVSVFPLYDIGRTVCGDRGTVFFIIPAGADPHTFEPRPSIAQELQKTTLFIGVTREFDGWIEQYLPSSAVRVYLMEAPRRGQEPNPHIWLSVRRSREIAGAMARHMSAVDPGNGARYRENLRAYDSKLNELDKTIAALFMNKTRRSFIQWHEAWNYFAADYGLTISGTVQREGSDKMSVRSMKEIVDRARREHVTAIIVSLNAEERTARVLADEIGGNIVMLDGIGDPESDDRSSYLKLMRYNAEKLAAALR